MATDRFETAETVRGDRLLAYLLDFVLLTMLTVFIWGVFSVINVIVGVGSMGVMSAMDGGGAGGAGTGATLGVLLIGYVLGLVQWVLIGAVLAGYFVLLTSNSGQTLGKRLTGITVRADDGTPCTQSQAIKRTAVLLAPLPVMALSSVFVPLVGLPIALFLMIGWLTFEATVLFVDDDAQRFGDRLANTVVVEAVD